MNYSSGFAAVVAAASLLAPSPVDGQDARLEIEIVERVLAVVGDSAILMTELEQALFSMEAAGWARPTGPAELLETRLEILELLINQQVVLQEAAKDSLLTISEEELEDRVQQEIEGQIRQYGTLGRLQEDLAAQGMTLAVFREQKKTSIRIQLLQERYFAKRGRLATSVVVTEEEARAYYEENPQLFPERPAQIRFVTVQLEPQASDSAKVAALARADSVLLLLQDGLEFPEAARRFSDGPSAEDGGELGWVRVGGGLVKEFEDAVFSMAPGRISRPVETSFGYHLILVERVRGGERRVRHTLFTPEITDRDVDANDTLADSLSARLRAGETMEDLGLEPDTVELSLEQIAQTSREFAVAMQGAEAGDVVGPIQIADARGQGGWSLARVLGTTSAGVGEFSDFQEVIEQRLMEQGLTATVIEELREQTHIEIRLGQR